MAQFRIKLIDETKCWIITGKKPFQVKLLKQKGRVLVKCPCDKYKILGDCEHCKSVRDQVPVVKFIVPDQKELKVIEYIGGNIKKQVTALIKSVRY